MKPALPARLRTLLCAPLAAALFALCATPAFANTFTVDTSTDGDQQVGNTTSCKEVTAGNVVTGHCSLRAAIAVGNGITGPHTITFSTPLVTIQNGAMTDMRATFVVDGNNAVIINGNGQGCLTLTDSGTEQASPAIHNGKGATGSTIKNLSIGHCSGAAISANGHGYTFSGNFIGVVGPLGLPGIFAGANKTVGAGISLSASAAYDSQFIDVAGLQSLYSALPVQPVDSSQINSFSVNIATALQNLNPNTISGNTISNNGGSGIDIFSENLAATIITNNHIGTDPLGATAVPNGAHGIVLEGSTFANLIGPGNTIAGNAQDGIHVSPGAVYLPNFIMGNYIGVNGTSGATATHVGNGQSGVFVDTFPDTSAGHFNPSQTGLIIGPLNVIADNQGVGNVLKPDDQNDQYAGIVITGSATGIKVLGNRIGLTGSVTGTGASDTNFGNQGDGIIVTTKGNKIGGSGASDGNVIAANVRHGIVVKAGATSNSLLGNSIGVDPGFAGNLGLGNGIDGIHIDNGNTTTIGGTGSTDFNTIVANGRNGIKIRNGDVASGWGNLAQRNVVFHNAVALSGVGIDLDYTENATDAPHTEFVSGSYANFDQASPVLCAGPADTGLCAGSVAPNSSAGTTMLQWTLASHGPANFRIEFFQIDSADDNTASSMTFLAEQLVSTDVSGLPSDSAACAAGVCTAMLAATAGGSYIIATATDVTPLTNTAGNLGDWKSSLICFAGDIGISPLASCPVNNTSEYSNVATVASSAPTVLTVAASAVTLTGATLNGTISANGADAGVSFEYGPTATYGQSVNGTPSTVAAATSNQAVSAAITGLTCGNTYHFRAEATNANGTTLGSDLTFSTAACAAAAPTVTSLAATAITATTATLNGTVSANGAQTTASFDSGLTTSYGSNHAAAQSPLSAGASGAAISYDLSGLTCNTTYHFRAKAQNSVSSVNGGDLSFKTAVCAATPPTATTGAASAIGATTATLNGSVSANGATTAATFDFGTTNAYGALGSPATATQSPLSSGASNAAVSIALTGLTCNTTYHFRANANNGIGATVNGSDATFTTGACVQPAPGAITFAASNVTATGATLNGKVSANGAATTVSFDYGNDTSYGFNLAATQSPLAAGSASNTAVSVDVSGLGCGLTYHFRVDASNSGGNVNGNDTTFTTAPCAAAAPTVTTGAASGITTSAALLNGTVSANGASTTVGFDYGPTIAYGQSAAATQSPLSAGATSAPVSATVSALSCGTSYHFRVNATNSQGGPVNGTDQTFTTGACAGTPPDATTGAASAITATTASVAGTVSANGAATTVTFEYGTTTAYGQSLTAAQSPLASNAPANSAVSGALSGLTCNTGYHYRVDANNGTGGTLHGADQAFTTSACPAAAPTATSSAATAISATGATFNGTVSANGAATTVTFEYGTSAAYGSMLSATQSPLAANASNAAVSVAASGLACATLYHFRVDANNGVGGTVTGSDLTFTTGACPAPAATTGAASAITASSATLNGTVSSNGASTTVTFEYGTSAAYGSNATATQSPLAASASGAAVSAPISGLACATLYHFRVDASNGTAANGNDATFTTSACPAGAPSASTGAASAVTATSATLNGTVTANGASTTVTFEYGTSAAYGSNATAAQSPLAGSASAAPVSAAVSALACGTTYHFRADANNGNGGTVFGADATFTTTACAATKTFSGSTATGTGMATAVLSGGGASCSFSAPQFVAAPVAPPAGVTFPDGLFQFSAVNCTGSITVTVTFPTAFSAGEQYYKYGPTPGPTPAHWYTLGAGNSLSLAGNVATFTIADGGLGDDDLAVNGMIVDQGGPAVPPPATPGAVLPAPTLGIWALFALAGLLALLGAGEARRTIAARHRLTGPRAPSRTA